MFSVLHVITGCIVNFACEHRSFGKDLVFDFDSEISCSIIVQLLKETAFLSGLVSTTAKCGQYCDASCRFCCCLKRGSHIYQAGITFAI